MTNRDQFRTGVFARDKYTCVACPNPAQDAHHIIERRLWPDGGYHLDDGVSLCGDCHIKAEQTLDGWDCDHLRMYAGITTVLLPPHFYPDTRYDKWGNILLPNGRRLPGELFDDESVRKILVPVHHLFDYRVKYPRTWHLPWSPSVGPDDRVLDLDSLAGWVGTHVVITEKMDGENTTLYRDYMHARSIDYSSHVTRNWMRNFHAKIAPSIPPKWRVCGENVSFKHSIGYDKLQSFFLVFSIWDGLRCLPWVETLEWCALLSGPDAILHPVPEIYRGPFESVQQIRRRCELWESSPDSREGYVIRPLDSFTLHDFTTKVGKYVRKNHVTTHGHWMRSRFEPNKLLCP
jgi:hypothetical protein